MLDLRSSRCEVEAAQWLLVLCVPLSGLSLHSLLLCNLQCRCLAASTFLCFINGPSCPGCLHYQGYSQPWSSLPLLASNLDTADLYHSQQLQQRANALCYTPTAGSSATIFDLESGVPFVCDAFAASDSDVISVSARVLRTAPACTLRLTLAPQVPIRRCGAASSLAPVPLVPVVWLLFGTLPRCANDVLISLTSALLPAICF